MNSKSQQSYREIHSSRSSVALTQRKQSSKGFARHPNGIAVGSSKEKQAKGLIVLDDGNVVLNIKPNGFYSERLYCFSDMGYCYEAANESRTGIYSQLLFYKCDSYLVLYTLKNGKQDGFQHTYDYQTGKMAKSYYKNNQLRQVVETCVLSPRQAEQHPEFAELFGKFAQFDFNVEGCRRLEISETMTYFGETRNEAPNGFGVILALDERYLGCFRDGLLEGLGSIYFPNGDVCEGLYLQGESNRCSKYTKPYGTIYFLDGRVCGEKEYSSIISGSRRFF